MSRSSFVFTPTALRSLEHDQDLLDRHEHKRRLASCHLSSYLLRKEARERAPPRPTAGLRAAVCRDLVVQNAVYTGDLEALQRFFPRGSTANLIIEPHGGDMRWTTFGEAKATGCVLQFWNCLLVGDDLTMLSIVDDDEYEHLIDAVFDTSNIEEWKNFRFNYRCLRLWSLSYEQELTTPLHITAGRGFTDCLRLLLQRGANVELAPGGITALHESCENCQPECTKLLLIHGANANAVSDDGLMPLHVCTRPESLDCAKYLLQYGAAINGRTTDEDDTPLHVAARNGLPEHAELYLRYGAAVNKQNDEGLTALNAACSQRQEVDQLQSFFKVCQILQGAGADIHTLDQDKRTPLHMACKNANPGIVEMLLASGANVNDMDYGGEAPMHKILKEVCYKVSHQPERIVRALLNYGSIRVWPGALPLVLKHCCQSPRTIEVLLNAYSHLKVTDTWVESVSPEALKDHREFYESLFSLTMSPRSLQHLARHTLRSFLDSRLQRVVPELDLPTFIKNYLLLDFRGYVH